MARVTDRGQALLVGAVVLAAAFLALALVLNGALYERTLSSEASEEVTGTQVVAIQDAVRGDVATVMKRAVNRSSGSGGQESYARAVLQERRVGANYTRHYAERDVFVRVFNPDPDSGRNASGDPADLANPEFSGRRAKTFEIEGIGFDSDVTGPYRVRVGGHHEVRIDDDRIRVANTTAGTGVTCTTDRPEYVNLANGTYRTSGGSDVHSCPALAVLARPDGNYSLGVSNADRINSGTYRYFVRDESANDHIYQVSVDVVIHSESVHYEGTIRVAPGEPR